MAHEYPKIPADQHQKILAEEILQDLSYTDVTPQERPRAIIMAGQPGAGKGNLVDAAKAELGGNVVTVDPDNLRDYHPEADNLKKQRPYTWSGETHGDASAWSTELRDAAVSERKHLILDTTTPRADVIKDLQAKGYDVEVRAIATHRIESELGVDQRFTKQLMDEGHGRYVPGEVRDNVYQQLPNQLDKVAHDTGAPIRIYDREGQLHYDSRTQPKVSPGQALEAAREGRMNIFRAGEMERSIHDQRRLHRDLPEQLPNAKVDASTTTHLMQERHDVLALGANTDSRNNLDQGWPKELAEKRQGARIEAGLNTAWKEAGHVSAIRSAMQERGIQPPELPAELQERNTTPAAAQQDPRDAFRAQENRDRSSDSNESRSAAPPPVSPAHQRQFDKAHAALAPVLSARGFTPEQIDRISAAAVGHAQQHAHRGDIQAVFLSKDGQRVAVLQEGQPMGEYSVNTALTQSKEQHLEQAHTAAVTQAREQHQEQQAQTTSERTAPTHAPALH